MSNVGIKMKKFVVSQYKAWASLFALWSIQVRSVQQRVTLSVGTSLTPGRFPLSKACSLWVICHGDQSSCSVLCSGWSSLRISIWCQCVTKHNLLYIRSRQSRSLSSPSHTCTMRAALTLLVSVCLTTISSSPLDTVEVEVSGLAPQVKNRCRRDHIQGDSDIRF